jgi:hypothetical protein
MSVHLSDFYCISVCIWNLHILILMLQSDPWLYMFLVKGHKNKHVTHDDDDDDDDDGVLSICMKHFCDCTDLP